MNYEVAVEVMRALALEAGSAILEVYNRADFNVRLKSDDSPVTEADELADDLIFCGLRAAFPDAAIVSEEQADSHTQKHDVFFIVDPLDGTKEFIKRRGDFTVNIALVENGVPVRGVVYAPERGRLFYTKADGETVEETAPFSSKDKGVTRVLVVADPGDEPLIVVASKSHRDQATDDYIGLYDVADSRSAGSSLKFCLVAAGEAHLYPRLGRTMEWDTAAGHAVLLGAGGEVVRFDNHMPLVYGKAGYENPFFIAHASRIALLAG